MGSAAHAVHVIKENRALQRTGNKAFLQKNRVDQPRKRKSIGNKFYKPNIDVQPPILRPVLAIMAVFIVATILSFYMISSFDKPSQSQLIFDNPTASDLGYEHLRKNEYTIAYDHFRTAEYRNPDNVQAHIGVMLCYYASCDEIQRDQIKYDNAIYCEEAAKYRAQLIQIGVITSDDIDQLIYSLRACNYAALVPANIGTKLKSPKSSS